jgi:hypothetical protein
VQLMQDELERSNDAFLSRRVASVRSFWERKIAAQQKRLTEAQSRQGAPQYIRMLEGTLRRLCAEFKRAEAELEAQRGVEVNYDEVAAGVLEVVPATEA